MKTWELLILALSGIFWMGVRSSVRSRRHDTSGQRFIDPHAQGSPLLTGTATQVGSFGRGLFGEGLFGNQR